MGRRSNYLKGGKSITSFPVYAWSDRESRDKKSWMLGMNEGGEGVLYIYEKQDDGRNILVETKVLEGGKMSLVCRQPIVDGVYWGTSRASSTPK